MGKICIKYIWKEGIHSIQWTLVIMWDWRNQVEGKSDVGSNEQVQDFSTMARRKGKIGKFGPHKKKNIDMSNI